MKSNWKEERLGSLVRFSSGGTPNKNNPSYWNGTIPWISAKNMKSEVIETSDLSITEEGLIHGSKIAPKGSLLLLVRGSGLFNGIPVCYLENAVAYNQDVKCIESTSELENKYLFYWLKANSGYLRKKIEFTSIGAGKFDTRFLSNLVVRFPDKVTRKKIIDIADNISDRININRKINENLAEQAQGVLYHFMDKQPYQLHPLSDIAIVIDCLHSKKPSSIEDSIYQLIQLDNIRDDGFLDMSATRYMISQADYINWTRKCEIVEGDCVITNVGRIGAVSQAPYGTKAAMGRNMTCIRLKPGIKLQAYFITVLLSNHMRRQIQSNTDEGTIMGALNVKNIPKLLFPIFEPSVMTDLEGVLFPLRKQIEYNNLQNQTLAQLRDCLLPKLMSGELDVSELAL